MICDVKHKRRTKDDKKRPPGLAGPPALWQNLSTAARGPSSQARRLFFLCLRPPSRGNRGASPVHHFVGIIKQTLGHAPVAADFDGAAFDLVAERRQAFGLVGGSIAVVDLEVEGVAQDQRENHPVVVKPGAREHAPADDAAERRHLIFYEFDELVGHRRSLAGWLAPARPSSAMMVAATPSAGCAIETTRACSSAAGSSRMSNWFCSSETGMKWSRRRPIRSLISAKLPCK